MKTKSLSLVSHEFKTPLSGILTSATLVEKYKKTVDQGKRDKHLSTIIGEVRHLNGILTDFLPMEKLEKGKAIFDFSMFSLSKVVNGVVYNANMSLKMGQRIDYPNNFNVEAVCPDEKIMVPMLTNFLDNAAKYSPVDSEMEITMDVVENMLHLSIKDQGMGIPVKDQKHMFERYFRAKNALLNQRTGIGLNIIRDHINTLRGQIYFERIEHKGSTFTVELPIGGRIHSRQIN